MFLQTSPEYAMKRLLAAGSGSIFQIATLFARMNRGAGTIPSSRLLEWYREGYDYQQLMDEMELLITSLSLRQCDFSRIRYKDLFRQSRWASTSMGSILRSCAPSAGGALPDAKPGELDFDQCFDLLLGMVVAPTMRGYQFVYDYPLSQASLARVSSASDAGVVERFELFYDGIELANGFSELTDASQQRARFEADNLARKRKRDYPAWISMNGYWPRLDHGLEDCAGVALGLDRLLMVLLDLDSIDQVLTFRD